MVEHEIVFGRVGFFLCSVFSATSNKTGVTIVSGKTDVVKGRLKEAAGALTGNDKLRAEGKADQAVGKVKQVAEKAIDKVRQAAKEARRRSGRKA